MTPTATLKPNREDLNKLWSEWRQHVFDRGFDGEAQQRFALLLEYERAVIDREFEQTVRKIIRDELHQIALERAGSEKK